MRAKSLGEIDDGDIGGIILNVIAKEFKNQESKYPNFVEGLVMSVNPLNVKINNALIIDSDFIKKLNTVQIEVNDKVLMGKQFKGQCYYILGVIE